VVGPEAAPLVTLDQVKTFLEAVDLRFPFHRGAAFKGADTTMEWDEKSNMHVPRLGRAAGGVPWQEGADGKVSDGREAYLTKLVYRTVEGNQAALEEAHAQDGLTSARGAGSMVEKFIQHAAIAVAEQFEATAEMSGRWRRDTLRHEVRERVARLAEKALAGRISLHHTRQRSGSATGQQFVMPAAAASPAAGGTAPETAEPPADPELSFLPPNRLRGKGALSGRKLLSGYVEPPVEGAPGREIPADRGPIAGMIQDGLLEAFECFFSDVYGARRGEPCGARPHSQDSGARVHILRAPTGAGKTSRCIRFIAEDPRTYQDHTWMEDGAEKSGRAPIAMLLPTYNNIDELRQRAQVLNLDGDLSDEELRKAASDLGLIAEDELDGKIAELRRDALNCADLAMRTSNDARGFSTMTYSGKIRAGCRMQDKLEMAMAAGIGTSAFCKATVRDRQDDASRKKGEPPPEPREVKCPHYDECPAIGQRARIGQAHVVFMPHSFLSLAIPDEIRRVRAVIADERIHHLFLHMATLSAATLAIPRKPPRLSQKEKDSGVSVEDLLMERDLAADIALRALRDPDRSKCPAAALMEHCEPDAERDENRYPGPRWVQSAIRVCSNAIQRDGVLSPEVPIEKVKEMCSQPTGREIREELQFWTIIQQRIAALRMDGLRDAAIRETRARLAGFQGEHDPDRRLALEKRLASLLARPDSACGATDARIQHLIEDSGNGVSEVIRISWRGKPNWEGVPMLLLDASAAPSIIAKIWNRDERAIVTHDIVEDTGMSLNVKIVGVVNQTFSNSSVIAARDAPRHVRIQAARNLANVRQALSAVSALHGDGRVVAGASIAMRKVINNGWVGPDNVDWCHFGALRGLDMFKHHGAAFSVGRMEVPVRTIDGLVAALTYDDPEPEPPFDFRGDGKDADGADLRVPTGDQRLRLRSGYTAVLPVPMFPGKWGRLIQRQYREEELLQFVGRLRPVYREGRTPVWFALSSIIPEELIVDELVAIDDLLQGPTVLWDAARRTGGVVEPNVLAAACADCFRTPEAALSAMSAMGFDREAGRIAARPARGHVAARWHPRGGGPDTGRLAFVRASVPDPGERLRSALLKHLKVDAEVEVLGSREPSLARPRQDDAVEKCIGARVEREAKATERYERICEMLLDSPGRYEDSMSTREYETSDGIGGSRLLSLPEVGALLAIDDHWTGGADGGTAPEAAHAGAA